MRRLGITPSQTIGPFFHMRMPAPRSHQLVALDTVDRIRIEGRVLDGAQHAIDDALIELWQADREGRYAHPIDRWPLDQGAFTGFGRACTVGGTYRFDTLKPGSEGVQAPHLSLTIFACGMLRHLCTRMYFPDEVEANAKDPLLSSVPPERRGTLIATFDGTIYRFDIVLQGERETVFLAV